MKILYSIELWISTQKSSVLLALILLMNVFISSSKAELSNDYQKKIKSLNAAYYNGKVSEQTYVNKIDTLVNAFLNEGQTIGSNELSLLLQPLEEIAEKKNSSYRNKTLYYKLLLENAQLSGKGGEAIYFTEKYANVIEKLSGEKSIVELAEKSYFFVLNGSYKKAIELADKEDSLLKRFEQKIIKGNILQEDIIKYFHTYATLAIAYSRERDSIELRKKLDQLGFILENLPPKIKQNQGIYAKIRIYKNLGEIHYYLLKEDVIKAENAVSEIEKIAQENSKALEMNLGILQVTLLESKIDIAITAKDNEKTAKYIEEYKKSPLIGVGQDFLIKYYTSMLESNKGNYKAAFELLSETMKEKDKFYAAIADEMDELLYAHTEAEYNRNELERAEKIKKQRMNIIIIVSSVAGIIILVISLLMYYRHTKSKERISNLNTLVDFQIAEMEQIRYQAIRDEQKRLGKELHDGLAASIAGIKHQIEIVQSDIKDASQKELIQKITSQLDYTYQIVRQKSHDWNNNIEKSIEQTFEEQIKQLMENALPNNYYKNEILIDEQSLQKIDLNTRIELLRIVQEAIVNIIKHAKAKSISILLFEENDKLILEVKDDGKGFEPQNIENYKSLGLKSMLDRVKKLSGNLTIHSGNKGTELIFEIPVQSKIQPMSI